MSMTTGCVVETIGYIENAVPPDAANGLKNTRWVLNGLNLFLCTV